MRDGSLPACPHDSIFPNKPLLTVIILPDCRYDYSHTCKQKLVTLVTTHVHKIQLSSVRPKSRVSYPKKHTENWAEIREGEYLMKKALTIIVILLVLAGAGFFGYRYYQQMQQASAKGIQYETTVIKEDKLVSTISAIGKVRAVQSATLGWETSGTVEAVKVAVGSKVAAGDILANLVQTSLPQSVILAQADLVSAQQSLEDLYLSAETSRTKAMQDIVTYEQAVRDAQYTLDNFTIPTAQQDMNAVDALTMTKKALDEARTAFEPYKFAPSNDSTRKRLLEDLNLAQSDYNAAIKRLTYEYELEVAQANLEKAQNDYKKWENGPATADIEAAKARIAAAQATLAQISIVAPFAGTVTQVKPIPGDQVSPSTTAFRIDDLTALYIDLEVSEIDVNLIHPNMEVAITLDAIRGKEYHGKVTQVALISSQGSDVVNFTVSVQLTDPDEQVRPGMTSEVSIIVSQKDMALLVPTQSVRLENGKQVVYVIRGEQPPTPIEVTLGMSSDAFSEVLTGDLHSGDTVVLNPPQEIQPDDMRMMFGGGPRNSDERPRDDSGPGGQP